MLVWSAYVFSRLQRMQNKIVRNLFKVHHPECSTAELFKKFSILTVVELYCFNLAISMFKILKLNQLPFLLNEIIKLLASHRYPTRSSHDIRVPFPRVSAIRHNFLFQAITVWNSLPISLKDEKNLTFFSKKCKLHFLS